MSGAEDTLPILNRMAAVDAMGGDEEMFDSFLDLFMEDAAKHTAEIEAAITDEDAVRVEYAAHSLKGAAATMHAERLSEVARELEFIGKSGDLANARSALSRLQAELDDLRQFVETL